MAPSRSRQRASPPSHALSPSPSPVIISLIETLLTSTPPLPTKVANSLHSLKLNPASLAAQQQVVDSLPHPPLSPPLNLLFSHLTLYHSHYPDSSLPILASNLTLPPTPPLLPSLSSISLLSRNPPPPLKSALLHQLPSLLPPLNHLLLHPPTISHSLIILLNISSAHPQSLLPYWSLFLPPSKSLTDLLYSPNQSLRSHSTSTLHNLISGARQLLRNLPLSQTPSSNAFTSTGLRALRVARALHLTLAHALNNESDGVVLAKLSKLAALLFNCVSYPSVDSEHVNALMNALRTRVFAERPLDLTSRAAATAAMAAGLMKSGQVVEGIESLCEDVVQALKHKGEEPLVELLSVLRGVMQLKSMLFAGVWENIGDRLVELASDGKGESLHCVRLLETWLMGAVVRAMALNERDSPVAGIASSAEELILAWEVHETILRDVACSGGQKLQAVGLGAIENLLRLTDYVGELMEWKLDAKFENQVLTGGRPLFLRITETASMLQEFALSGYGNGVRIAAIRSLASAPVGSGDTELILSVLRCFHEVIRKQGNDTGVRGKAMTAASTVIDRAVSAKTEIQAEVGLIFEEITGYAVNFLEDDDSIHMAELSAAARANVESSRIAAINIIACALRNHDQLQSSSDISRALNEQVIALSQVLESNTSVNVQCICTRAIGQILCSHSRHFGRESSSREKIVLTLALERSLEIGDVRLQIACAQVLTKLVNERPGASESVNYLFLYASVYERSACRTHPETDHTDNHNKRLLLSLQDVLSEHVYEMIGRLSEDWLRRNCGMWATSKSLNVNKTLIDAVFHHLSIPRHLAEYMKEPGVRTPASERERNGQLFLDSLSPDSRIIVEKVFRLHTENGSYDSV